MAAATKLTLAAAGSTGNNTHTAIDVGRPTGVIAFQFVIEAVGSTPTVTFKFQGSLDGTNWYDVLYTTDSSNTAAATAGTQTGTGSWVFFLSDHPTRNYTQVRCVTSSNTNVTYRAEAYVFDSAAF